MPRKVVEQPPLSVEDLSLPRTMVQRLAKGVLPPNTQIQKDALLAISKSATVFVNYLSARANENALSANKKTIQPRDVLEAIHDLEFADFTPRLEGELLKFTTIQNDKRNSYRRRVREQQIAAKSSAATEHLSGSQDQSPNAKKGGEGADAEPAAKKLRRESGAEDEEDDEDEDMEDTADIEDPEEEEEEDELEDEGEDEDEVEDEEGPSADELAEDALEAREDEDGEEESGEESD